MRSAAETLVLGGTGKTGRRIVRRLQERGVPVLSGSRSGSPPFDWEDEGTWEPILGGVRSAYLSYYPDLAAPGAASAVGAFARLAVDRGVRHLVLLSGRGEREAELTEHAVRTSGADWTILRCSWFAQNFSESFLLDGVLAGEIALPAGDVGEPFIDTEDIADVAVAALTEERHLHQVYELTGPRLLTFAEAVSEIGAAAGRDIRYETVGVDDYATLLSALGVPGDTVALVSYLFREVLDGRNAHVGDGVWRALDRAPRDFTEYAKHTAASGVWTAPAGSASA